MVSDLDVSTRDVAQALVIVGGIACIGLMMNPDSVRRMLLREKGVTLMANWAASAIFLSSFVCVLALGRAGSSLWSPFTLSMAVPLLFLLHKYVSACMLNFTPQAQEHTKYSISRDNTSKRSIALGVMFTLVAVGVSALPKAANGSRMESVTIEGAALASVLVALIYYFYFRSNKIDVTAYADIPLSQTDVQRCKTYPHPYPNGWYKLFNSNEVMPGDVKLSKCLGRSFVVYRGETDGKVGVLDAYCPHLGANLAVGGKVSGDSLVCPFHLWEFGKDGKVTRIPYADKVPEIAKTKSWPVTEYHGQICIYFDVEGRDPPYELTRYNEIDSGAMVYHGTTERIVKMHIQEFAENSVDYMHFQPLHGRMKLPWSNIFIPGLTIRHSAYWAHGESDPAHVAYFHDHAQLEFCGTPIPKTEADATITFMGPGGVVTFDFQIPDLGRVLMFQTHLPLSAVTQHVTFSWYADACIPGFLVSYIVGNWVAQWAEDLSVWENKMYLTRPLLVKGDGPVGKLRRWYAQFYSAGHPIGEEETRPAVEKVCTGNCEDDAATTW